MGDFSVKARTLNEEHMETIERGTPTPDCAVAAIEFALQAEDGMTFLRLWNEGEFDKVRRGWPEAPDAVYIGADRLHPDSASSHEPIMCRLPPSGFTETPVDVYNWAKAAADQARSALTGTQRKALIWTYRHDGCQMLMLALYDELENDHLIIFTTGDGFDHDFNLDEPYVPDLVEAVHMSGMVIRSLGAVVQVGRFENEVNEAVLAEVLKPGETSGALKVAQ